MAAWRTGGHWRTGGQEEIGGQEDRRTLGDRRTGGHSPPSQPWRTGGQEDTHRYPNPGGPEDTHNPGGQEDIGGPEDTHRHPNPGGHCPSPAPENDGGLQDTRTSRNPKKGQSHFCPSLLIIKVSISGHLLPCLNIQTTLSEAVNVLPQMEDIGAVGHRGKSGCGTNLGWHYLELSVCVI